jgi:hypothetical protein
MAEEAAVAIAQYIGEDWVWAQAAAEVIQAVAVVASVYNVREQQRKAQNASQAAYLAGLQNRYVMYRGTAEPRQVVLGKQRVSGPLAFIGSYGANRQSLVFAVILAAHEVSDIDSIYFNDEQLLLDGAGNVLSVYRKEFFSMSTTGAAFTLSSAPLASSVTAFISYGTTQTTLGVSVAGSIVTVSGGSGAGTGTVEIDYQPAQSPWATTATKDVVTTMTTNVSGTGSVTLPVVPVSGSVAVFFGDPYASPSDTALPSVNLAAYLSVAGAVVTITASPYTSASLVVAYRDATTTSKARVLTYKGAAGQAADPDMVANLGGAWTSAHKMTSLAYLRVELDYDPDAFPSGLPNVSARVFGAKLYDPRDGSTAFSQNPALMMRYVATSPLLGNLPTSAIDDTRIATAANICDGSVNYVVSGQTYTRPLYRAGLAVKSGTRAKDILDDLAKAMAGRWCFVDGTLKVKAGAYVTPLQTLTDTWLIGSQSVQIQAKPTRTDVYNTVTGKFADETRDYIVVDYPQVTAAAYVTEDGTTLPVDIPLNAVGFVGQAQQVIAAGLRDARQGLRVTLLCNMRAYAVEPFDTINVTLSRFGWVAKPFEVLDVSWTVDGGIQLTLKETSSTIWDLGTTFSAVDPAPNTLFPSPWTVPSITSLACASGTNNLLKQADGTVMTRIMVTWDPVTDALVLTGGGVEIRYGLSTAPEAAWQSVIAPLGQSRLYLTENLRDGQLYFVKARAFNGLVQGPWCVAVLHTVLGKSALPANVTGLTTSALPGGVNITVTASTEQDVLTGGGLELRTGASWAAGTTIFRGKQAQFVWPWPAAGTYSLMAKWFDSTGNYSATEATTSVTVGNGNLIDTGNLATNAATETFQATVTGPTGIGITTANTTGTSVATQAYGPYTTNCTILITATFTATVTPTATVAFQIATWLDDGNGNLSPKYGSSLVPANAGAVSHGMTISARFSYTGGSGTKTAVLRSNGGWPSGTLPAPSGAIADAVLRVEVIKA